MKYRVTIEGKTFEVEISDLSSRPIQAVVDGETIEVWPEEESAPETASRQEARPISLRPAATSATLPAAQPAPDSSATSRSITAPIPGVIVSIAVKPGDAVVFGQELCVLEAMKMKNAIRASRNGTIGKIVVALQDHVRHNQVLMEYAD